MAVSIYHNHSFFADQKMPVASDAVIEPGLAPEQSAITQRPDGKLVPKASFTALTAEEYGPPNLHEKLKGIYRARRKSRGIKSKLENPRRCSSTIVLQNEKVECVLTSAGRSRGARVMVLELE